MTAFAPGNPDYTPDRGTRGRVFSEDEVKEASEILLSHGSVKSGRVYETKEQARGHALKMRKYVARRGMKLGGRLINDSRLRTQTPAVDGGFTWQLTLRD